MPSGSTRVALWASCVAIISVHTGCTPVDVLLLADPAGFDAGIDSPNDAAVGPDVVPLECAELPDDSPCGASLDCTGLVRGLEQSPIAVRCVEAVGSIRGMCRQSSCVQATVRDCHRAAAGEAVTCEATCALPAPSCVIGEPFSGVSVATLCVTLGTTATCQGPMCLVDDDLHLSAPRRCDGSGTCSPDLDSTTSCAGYVCEAGACKTRCEGDPDCDDDSECRDDVCVPD